MLATGANFLGVQRGAQPHKKFKNEVHNVLLST